MVGVEIVIDLQVQAVAAPIGPAATRVIPAKPAVARRVETVAIREVVRLRHYRQELPHQAARIGTRPVRIVTKHVDLPQIRSVQGCVETAVLFHRTA